MLVAKERLGLAMDVQQWISKALDKPKINLLPLSPEIAVLSTRLPGTFHGDPADRIIVASCMDQHAILITKDKSIAQYKFIESLW